MSRKTAAFTFLCACLIGLTLAESPAPASDWMFRRSYYSHAPEFPTGDAPGGRSGYRDPFIGAHPRFAIRGGWRINNYSIRNGNSTDQTFIRENWFDVNY